MNCSHASVKSPDRKFGLGLVPSFLFPFSIIVVVIVMISVSALRFSRETRSAEYGSSSPQNVEAKSLLPAKIYRVFGSKCLFQSEKRHVCLVELSFKPCTSSVVVMCSGRIVLVQKSEQWRLGLINCVELPRKSRVARDGGPGCKCNFWPNILAIFSQIC